MNIETQTTILKYKSKYKQKCLIAFDSNTPKYFAAHERLLFDSFLDKLENEKFDSQYYVLLLENELIGCGGFGVKEDTNHLSLAWGLLHSNYHKKGYGKLLLQYRLNIIDKEFPNATLFVDTTQYNTGFFEKFGFVITQKIPNGYAEGYDRYDMERRKS